MESPCSAAEFRPYEGRKIGIFGGSFDPVHAGHVHLARLAKNALGLDEVRFLPCRISPHKTDRPPTPGEVRAEWLRIALEGISWAKLDLTELEEAGPSFSYRTLETLVSREPGNEWFWIMGGDQWTALPGWRNPEVIAGHAEFIVLARNGQEVLQRDGYRLHVVMGEHPASATEIRRAVAAGEKDIPYLHPGIAAVMNRRL